MIKWLMFHLGGPILDLFYRIKGKPYKCKHCGHCETHYGKIQEEK